MICTTFCFSEFVLKMFINNGIHKIINCLLWCLELHKNVLNNTNSEVKIYFKTVINNNDHFTPRKGSFTLCRKSVARPGGDLDLLHSLKRTLLNYSQVNYSTWIRFTGNLRERDDCDSTKIFGGNVAKNFCSFLNRDLAPNRDLIRERIDVDVVLLKFKEPTSNHVLFKCCCCWWWRWCGCYCYCCPCCRGSCR